MNIYHAWWIRISSPLTLAEAGVQHKKIWLFHMAMDSRSLEHDALYLKTALQTLLDALDFVPI